jgi:hypothetical protein
MSVFSLIASLLVCSTEEFVRKGSSLAIELSKLASSSSRISARWWQPITEGGKIIKVLEETSQLVKDWGLSGKLPADYLDNYCPANGYLLCLYVCLAYDLQ